MMLVANLANTKWCKKAEKLQKNLACRIVGFSYESTQWELSNEYQHDRVKMVFKNLCVLVLWTKVALALEGLIYRLSLQHQHHMIPRYIFVARVLVSQLSWCHFDTLTLKSHTSGHTNLFLCGVLKMSIPTKYLNIFYLIEVQMTLHEHTLLF